MGVTITSPAPLDSLNNHFFVQGLADLSTPSVEVELRPALMGKTIIGVATCITIPGNTTQLLWSFPFLNDKTETDFTLIVRSTTDPTKADRVDFSVKPKDDAGSGGPLTICYPKQGDHVCTSFLANGTETSPVATISFTLPGGTPDHGPITVDQTTQTWQILLTIPAGLTARTLTVDDGFLPLGHDAKTFSNNGAHCLT
jgi:hypothetical protein